MTTNGAKATSGNDSTRCYSSAEIRVSHNTSALRILQKPIEATKPIFVLGCFANFNIGLRNSHSFLAKQVYLNMIVRYV